MVHNDTTTFLTTERMAELLCRAIDLSLLMEVFELFIKACFKGCIVHPD